MAVETDDGLHASRDLPVKAYHFPTRTLTVAATGNQLAYQWYLEKEDRDLLRVISTTEQVAGAPRTVYDNRDVSITPTDWSPDGKWIAFASNSSGRYEVYRMHPDGTNMEQLTHLASHDINYLAWSPLINLPWHPEWLIGGMVGVLGVVVAAWRVRR